MRVLFSVLLMSLFALPGAAITEVEKISFRANEIELQFFVDGDKVLIMDPKGWLTLRVLTILLFQEQVEQSYQAPQKTAAILSSQPKHLSRLSDPISKTLLYLKKQRLSEDQTDLLLSIQESEIFNLNKDRKRTAELILNNKLKPLLEMEPLEKSLQMTINGKKVTRPYRSRSTADFISYELTTSQLEIPITQRPRTSPEITWDPKKIIFQY